MTRWLPVMVAVLALAGCNKPKARNNVPVVVVGTPATTTRPTTGPSTQPVATTRPGIAPLPDASTLIIDNSPITFPPTRIALDGPMLRVISDDPIAALKPDYQGNRYYFAFRLDQPLSAQNAAGFTHIGPTSNLRRDEPDGIFMLGDKKQLQARDVDFYFLLQGRQLRVEFRGSFLVFERGEMGPSQQVFVSGALAAPFEKH